jgi:uncharacterized protein (DUF58 family)
MNRFLLKLGFFPKRRSRSLKFTRLGWTAVALAFAVGLGALNTGNNLLYLVFGGVLGLILTSGLASETNLRGLDVDWIVPSETWAGAEARVRLLVRNAKTRAASLGLDATVSWEGRAPLSWHGRFLAVPAKSQRHADVLFTPPARGNYALNSVSISTEFPFGLFRKTKTFEREGSILVFPGLWKGAGIPMTGAGPEARRPTERGEGDSFWGVREFQPGDSLRRVSWKAAARVGRLVVTETERETADAVLLSFDPAGAWKSLPPRELEDAVSFAATLACRLLETGAAAGIVAAGRVLPPEASDRQKFRLLTFLALYDPDADPPWPIGAPGTARRVDVLSLWRSLR